MRGKCDGLVAAAVDRLGRNVVDCLDTGFHGCYSIGDDTLWGVNRRKKGAVNTLAGLKSIRGPA